ncbi:hypothetical protein HYT25_04055 [Candidatus Pacearchaeota archaeon]|nr:hypothetical protein [Candidatus Pacearchaeota archaeon]
MKSIDLKLIQTLQNEFDKQYFDRDYSQFNTPELEKLSHINLHLEKALGKIAIYLEKKQHGEECSAEQIIKEVIPDLLIYSTQIANLFNVNLDEAYTKRLEGNKKK